MDSLDDVQVKNKMASSILQLTLQVESKWDHIEYAGKVYL